MGTFLHFDSDVYDVLLFKHMPISEFPTCDNCLHHRDQAKIPPMKCLLDGVSPFGALQMEEIRQQIRSFKSDSGVDKVIVLWTANTERYSNVVEGLNDTAENFLAAIDNNEAEVAPSSIYAAASIQEGWSLAGKGLFLSIPRWYIQISHHQSFFT